MGRIGIIACVSLALAFVAQDVFAYVGPGAGITMLSALWAVILAVGGGILFWPIRSLLRKLRKTTREGQAEQN
jgi:uncharacterized iron-regulated membrane protein